MLNILNNYLNKNNILFFIFLNLSIPIFSIDKYKQDKCSLLNPVTINNIDDIFKKDKIVDKKYPELYTGKKIIDPYQAHEEYLDNYRTIINEFQIPEINLNKYNIDTNFYIHECETKIINHIQNQDGLVLIKKNKPIFTYLKYQDKKGRNCIGIMSEDRNSSMRIIKLYFKLNPNKYQDKNISFTFLNGTIANGCSYIGSELYKKYQYIFLPEIKK